MSLFKEYLQEELTSYEKKNIKDIQTSLTRHSKALRKIEQDIPKLIDKYSKDLKSSGPTGVLPASFIKSLQKDIKDIVMKSDVDLDKKGKAGLAQMWVDIVFGGIRK